MLDSRNSPKPRSDREAWEVAVDLARLGVRALAEGRLEEALTRHQAAQRLFQQLHERQMEAAAWHQLGKVHHRLHHSAEAERHYREAARMCQEQGHHAAAAQTWNDLAELLQNQPGRLADARQLAEHAVTAMQSLDPAAPEVWRGYGILGDIAESEALATEAGDRRAALEADARDYREVQRHGPVLFATLGELVPGPGLGRAVILLQLGRTFQMGRRPDVAIRYFREAVEIARMLPPSEGAKDLLGALEPAEDVQEEQQWSGGQDFEIALYEDLATDYVFGTDLLIDGPRQRRVVRKVGETDPVAGDVRPALLGVRAWMDDQGAVRFSLPVSDPVVERHPGCTVVRRIHREFAVFGEARVIWRLIQWMDGASPVEAILSRFNEGERRVAAQLIAELGAAGAIDVSGRAVGRFLHLATKKGVLPAGGLESDAVLQLATDGTYRSYPSAPRIVLGQAVPDRLRPFHTLTRARRSSRDYRGLGLVRADFDALLHTACGATGAMTWAGRDVKLRAYPSSGALYAVEVYPVVFGVEGLEPAVYHYRAIENVLEVVRADIDPATVVGAALPVERAMVAGAAVLFCLTGCFTRHERKYGEGGYRMLVAEAGHISQNLILAATALGLSARPFGGVFDGLLNHDLGLNTPDEQFLLAVLVGHASEAPSQTVSGASLA
jgi:SagB-type dehydrogenase family enzyme